MFITKLYRREINKKISSDDTRDWEPDTKFGYGYLEAIKRVLLGSGVEFFNDSGGGVESGNVGNLSSELLVLGADAAISIDHNITFLSVLNQTTVCSDAYIMS